MNASSVTAEGQEVARQYAAAVLEGSITIAQGTQFLEQYVQIEQQAAVATAQSADASAQAAAEHAKLNEALNAQASEALATTQATDQLKARQQELLAVLNALSNGSITQAQAESILAKNYGVTAAQLPGLINLTFQLAAARQAAAAAELELTKTKLANQKFDSATSDEVDIQRTKHALIKDQTATIRAQQGEINKAKRDQILTVGTHEQQLKLLQDEYNTMVKLHGANSALAIQAETALKKEQSEKQKGGGGGAKLSDQEKLNNQLLASQDKFNDKFEDADIKHFQKLEKIYDDYAKKTAEQLAKNETSKRRSRADFYSGLQDASGVDVTKFAASYEEAFKQAQDIAASGKAKLADDFLKLRQEQIKEMLDLEKEAADIQKQEASGDLSKKDAEAQLAFLEGRKKLIEDAQAEEQKQLLAAGDENQNRLQEQLDAEQEAYTNNTDKIALQAERAADAKITNAIRAKKAVSEENTVLTEQADIYDRIAAKNGGKLPAATARAPVDNTTVPAQPQADKTIDISAQQPIPVQTADILVVRQAEMFIVHDQDVINTLSDGVARIENRLIDVANSINSARDVISGSVKAVESAIGRIRVNNTNVVGP